jgi:hypothetical protein
MSDHFIDILEHMFYNCLAARTIRRQSGLMPASLIPVAHIAGNGQFLKQVSMVLLSFTFGSPVFDCFAIIPLYAPVFSAVFKMRFGRPFVP